MIIIIYNSPCSRGGRGQGGRGLGGGWRRRCEGGDARSLPPRYTPLHAAPPPCRHLAQEPALLPGRNPVQTIRRQVPEVVIVVRDVVCRSGVGVGVGSSSNSSTTASSNISNTSNSDINSSSNSNRNSSNSSTTPVIRIRDIMNLFFLLPIPPRPPPPCLPLDGNAAGETRRWFVEGLAAINPPNMSQGQVSLS